MSTKVPLHALLDRFNLYGHEQELIRNDLIKSVFGGMMNEDTPYERILTCRSNEEEISAEQQMCNELNEHLKNSQQYFHVPLENERIALSQELLTPKTVMDF